MSNAEYTRPSQGSARQDQYRPRTIAELAEVANNGLWDPSKPLKHWLRIAEKSRKDGNTYVEQQDYEAAFVQFAKAATLVLEKLPTHSEYTTLLSAGQRSNLGLNGQEILDNLTDLKPILVDRFEDWRARGGSADAPPRPLPTESISREEKARRRRDEERAAQAQEAAIRESEWRQAEEMKRENAERELRAQEEAAWARQSQEVRQRELNEAKRMEAREAAEHERAARSRREEAERRGYSYADEVRRDEERRRIERRREEHEGILRRQQEADAAARAAKREIASSSSSRYDGDPSYRRSQEPEPARAYRDPPGTSGVSTPQLSRPPSSARNRPAFHGPILMPVESPIKYDDDTDGENKSDDNMYLRNRLSDRPVMTPRNTQHISYPTPITTTSPAPPDLGSVQYPSLMSQHQLKQGYVPSLQSMFSHPPQPPPNSQSLLLETQPASTLYANILPKPSAPPPPPPTQYAPAMPIAEQPRYDDRYGSQRGPSPSRPRPRAPSVPPAPPTPVPSASRIVRGASNDSQVQDLKPVKLPRECLSRFVSIAKVNTERNRETCGLLLGKEIRGKYVVSVLLIPKQHSTSDTCTMDEEELVLQITESRKLITLGWIHTHPTQSCFMSSVDLHTHCGFQQMLPESFAIVCAPTSKPSFGIFRLTDPVGLHTILDCNAKEAFHPHPDVPIYTDCDSNHILMKDMQLEIVDLR